MGFVLVSDHAEDDLADIWGFIAQHSEEAADRTTRKIVEKLEHLADFPLMGRRRPEYGEHTRSFPLDRHVAVYEPLAEGIEGIFLLRVYHGREEMPMPGAES